MSRRHPSYASPTHDLANSEYQLPPAYAPSPPKKAVRNSTTTSQPRNNQRASSPSRSPPSSAGAYPDPSSDRLRAARRYSRQQENSRPQDVEPAIASVPYRDVEGRARGKAPEYTLASAYSNITPGADNFGEQAAGGISGIAFGVADANARESGLSALRNTSGYPTYTQENMASPYGEPSRQRPYDDPFTRPMTQSDPSQTSLPLSGASHSLHSNVTNDPFSDNPYNRYSRNLDPTLSHFDPNNIEDDGDDGLEYHGQKRSSRLYAGNNSDRPSGNAATGGVLGALGGIVGGRTASGNKAAGYDAVHNTAYGGPNDYDLAQVPEKSEWLNKQSSGRKRLKWIVGVLLVLLIIGGIAGGIAGGILSKKKSSSSSPSGQSASQDTESNGDLDKNSAEIQKLMNNKNLHKVFPAIDYTPMYTQYPDCLSYPPSQNNVTRDLAVLSQLTNTIRLYGTDCNQTQLLLHSIDQLDLNGTIKVWMGVWQDNNATTNARQIQQMYDIIDTHGVASFEGVIVGNEVLFRKDMTETELGAVITSVKSNLTSRGYNLPVASSDLGDNWTASFASLVDYVMANIHPFFAGVTADTAASWTYDFWTQHDTILKTDLSKNIISETGWPSAGGTDCGAATTCTTGSVAGVDEMNKFMDGWVCDALANGTTYFWFEAFDEPWKIEFNTPGKEWEDKWGLMDVDRNLKPGVVIPDCGGKTV